MPSTPEEPVGTWGSFADPLIMAVLVELGKRVADVRYDEFTFHWNIRGDYYIGWREWSMSLVQDDLNAKKTPARVAAYFERQLLGRG